LLVGHDVTCVSPLEQGLPAVLQLHDAGPLQHVVYEPPPQFVGPAMPVPQRHSEGLALQP
jgi:hypothetical protein